MEIQIDFKNKKITLLNEVTVGELVSVLDRLDLEDKDKWVITSTKVIPNQPIFREPFSNPSPTQPYITYPNKDPFIVYCDSNPDLKNKTNP